MSLRFPAAVLTVIAVAACIDAPTAPVRSATAPNMSLTEVSPLLECVTAVEESVTGVIGASGGVLSVGGATIALPGGAVNTPTTFRVTVPASPFVEVDIKANDLEHFQFRKPVVISISYARCTQPDIDSHSLVAYHIEPSTKRLLERMGGRDDKYERSVTFTTDHLSGYSVGYAQPGDGEGEGESTGGEEGTN